jgi:hypothetical protein
MPSKKTLFTLRGSGGALLQQLVGTTLGNYDQMVAEAVDSDLWEVVDVLYAGGMVDLCNNITVQDGVNRLVRAIKETQGQFALVGNSQGAIVCSEVYKRIRTGDLGDRKKDLIAAVMFGNPEREGGHTIPGGIDPGGVGGVANASDRLYVTENLWWEFADPNDIFAVNPDSAYGRDATLIYDFIMLNWQNLFSDIIFLLTSLTYQTAGSEIQGQFQAILRLLQYILPQGLSVIDILDPEVNQFGHLRYHFVYEGLPGNTTKSAVQLAAEYLDEVAGRPYVITPLDLTVFPDTKPSKNLVPGQFQIGNLVMGEWTPFKIEKVDIGNYDVNVQDYQAQASNETRFGQDTLKPAPLQLTINILKNALLENVAALVNSSKVLNFDDDKGLSELQKEWRAGDIMMQWGAVKPLYFCGSDGIVRQFFGRPGKFSYQLHRIRDSEYYICNAEFRRLDTYAHSEQEWYIRFTPEVPQTVTLTRGKAPSWIRFNLKGPLKNPIINFGPLQLQIDTTELYPFGILPAGEYIEISSYPWVGRRVIDTLGHSLAAYMTMTPDPYLDKLFFPENLPLDIGWHADETVLGDSEMVLLFHDAYQVME